VNGKKSGFEEKSIKVLEAFIVNMKQHLRMVANVIINKGKMIFDISKTNCSPKN